MLRVFGTKIMYGSCMVTVLSPMWVIMVLHRQSSHGTRKSFRRVCFIFDSPLVDAPRKAEFAILVQNEINDKIGWKRLRNRGVM